MVRPIVVGILENVLGYESRLKIVHPIRLLFANLMRAREALEEIRELKRKSSHG